MDTPSAQSTLKVRAPARIDLSGGTLDIWPLYLLTQGGLTLNCAVDLYCEVELEPRADLGVRIEAIDLDLALEAPRLDELDSSGEFAALDLIVRILRFYRPRQGLLVRTRSRLPPGSGLGGSSSLLICLSTALVQLENLPWNKQAIIEHGEAIETQSLRVPAGKQDYYPAAYGGFNALWMDIQGVKREALALSEGFRQELRDHLLLGYTGASRFSGGQNWEMMKRYIDGDHATVRGLDRIKQTSLEMYGSLKDENLQAFSRALAREWENRRTLAEGVATPRVEKVFKAAAGAGALATKICGAGGGGCFVTVAEKGCRSEVRKALRDQGATLLEYDFDRAGVQVSG